MNKTGSCFHIILVIISFAGFAHGFCGGDGTSEDPYQIATADELVSIGSDVNLLDKHFILTADIDLSGCEFTAAVIAPDVYNSNYDFDSTPFTGTFNGDGYSISNLKIDTISDDDNSNDGNDFLALFGCVISPGVVKNLDVKQVKIACPEIAYSNYISGLVASNGLRDISDGGVIENCTSSGNIKNGYEVGGLAGLNFNGVITNCSSSYNMSIESSLRYGNYIGCLVGYNRYGTIESCYSTGAIVTGYNMPGLNIGGLIGTSSGTVNNCFSICNVDNYTSGPTGGLIARSYGTIISNCYAIGNVTGGDRTGGLIGYSEECNILNCYSTGSVGGTDKNGFIEEEINGTVTGCFWDIETSGKAWSQRATGRTTAEMKTLSYYINAGWDFSEEDGNPSVWKEVPNMPPILVWQDMITVPDVTVMTEHQAVETIKSIGLSIGQISSSYNDGIKAGSIISQSVLPGNGLPTGYPVDLEVSLGAAERRFRIETPEDLIRLGHDTANYDKQYILMNDIDMSDYIFEEAIIAPCVYINEWGWLDGHYFSGVLDGNGHKISNITIETPLGDALGLFGVMTGQVKNLGIENIHINGIANNYYVGAIAGDCLGEITDCYSTGIISLKEYSKYVGGITGAGGRISRCYSKVNIRAFNSENSSNNSEYTGGLVGRYSIIRNCYSSGAIIGHENTGGLLGGDGRIINSYSTGSVYGDLIGGLAGFESTIITSYSAGKLIGTGRIGGLIGDCIDYSVRRSFWDEEAAEANISSGTGLPTARMQDKTTYTGVDVGWSFTSDYGNSAAWQETQQWYPALSWQSLVEAPNLTGMDLCQSKQIILDSGLKVGRISASKSQSIDAGYIISQNPRYPSIVPKDQTFDLVVSIGRGHYSGGAGTEEDPWQINRPEDLISLGKSAYDYESHFILTDDIDMSDYPYTSAVIAPDLETNSSFQGVSFKGTFNGNGFTISNLTIDTLFGYNINNYGSGFLGLFGKIGSGGKISNLSVINAVITSNSGFAGAIAADNEGEISRCYTVSKVQSRGNCISSFVGRNSGTLEFCYSEGVVYADEYSQFIGGLVGHNTSTQGIITNCYSIVDVITEGNYAGGISGNSGGIIDNCYSAGLVQGFDKIGGLVGNIYAGEVTDCFWNIETSKQIASAAGTGLTSAQMQDISIFTDRGWDFCTDDYDPAEWRRVLGWYPVLRWEKLIDIPDVTNLTPVKAKECLLKAGFSDAVFSYSPNDTVPAGLIIGPVQSEPSAPVGKPVLLTVSLGSGSYRSTGSGTLQEPWKINTPEDLIQLGISTDDYDKHFILNANISMSQYLFKSAVISPDIAFIDDFQGTAFTGTFDGGGFKISNLTIDTLNGKSIDNNNDFLGLFGQIGQSGTIKNLFLENAGISGSNESLFVASLAGDNLGQVINSYSSVQITSENNVVGGLVGRNGGSINNCYTTGSVFGKSDSKMNGGLVGHNMQGTIENCYSHAKVVCQGQFAGGLVGNNGGDITNSYSVGFVFCNNLGGGLTGKSYSGDIRGCFWDKETSDQIESQGGVGKTTAEMQDEATFVDAGWDFEGDWWINDGRDYPRLSWQPFGDVNNDSRVDAVDLGLMGASWMSSEGEAGFNGVCELSGDDVIGMDDLMEVVDHWLEEPQYDE